MTRRSDPGRADRLRALGRVAGALVGAADVDAPSSLDAPVVDDDGPRP